MLRFVRKIFALAIVLSVFMWISTPAWSSHTEKKIIVIILDQISLQDIQDVQAPNLQRLINTGGIAYMNIRPKFRNSNRGSSYLSIGMGIRTTAPAQGSLAFNTDEEAQLSGGKFVQGLKAGELYSLFTGNIPEGEVVNLAIANIAATALKATPSATVGLLGEIARENNIVFGILGNSDTSTPRREGVLLAMDKKGIVPYGNVSDDLLTYDANILGGQILDNQKLLSETKRILPKVDVLFIDYGDVARIEASSSLASDEILRKQRLNVITRLDKYLEELFAITPQKTVYMVLVPNPSREMLSKGNFGLTPFIMSDLKGSPCLLTSASTRREGLVTNFDLGATVFSYFDLKPQLVGNPIHFVANNAPLDFLLKEGELFLNLREIRYTLHALYIGFLLLVLLLNFIPVFIPKSKFFLPYIKFFSLWGLSLPLTFVFSSYIGYASLFADIAFIFAGAFLISLLITKFSQDYLFSIGLVCALTASTLLIDVFLGAPLTLISPLGSDAIAGGRFYGIGNDLMGILLGSTVTALFIFVVRRNNKKHYQLVLGLIPLLACVVALIFPQFGANIGGSIGAMAITLIYTLKVLDKNISFRKLFLILFMVFAAIWVFAFADAFFNPNPSHAGKAVQAMLENQGFGKIIELIRVKLGLFLWNLFHSSWNLVLLLQFIILILLIRLRYAVLQKTFREFPYFAKEFSVFLFGGLVIFLFNDSGTIAAALMLTYLFVQTAYLMQKAERN